MKFEAKEITLKNGKTATLKSPDTEDAAQLINFLITVCGETEFLAAYPEERQFTVEKEEAWINGKAASENSMAICCYVDGKVVGNCEVNFFTAIKYRHRASLAISILQEYWNLGIGSAMFRELIAAAEAHGSSILELEYIEGNERGKALYEKFGFTALSEKPNAFRLKDGSFRKEIYMQKQLKPLK